MRTEGFRGVLLSALIIASLMVPAISLLSVSPSSAAPEGLTPHAPIYIDGNDNFTPANGVNGGGSGTENDPYIIENWEISTETTHGIWIENTDAYFVIRNCYVHGVGTHVGIYFYNMRNAKIDNNLVENNYYGIYLSYSDNNLVSNSTCGNNGNYGISLFSSSNNTLDNNTCENNDGDGIHFSYSSNNILTNSTLKGNERGIQFSNSNNNDVEYCVIENNKWRGIALDESANNTITNCVVENSFRGIELYWSENNNISDCVIENNEYGILIANASDNNIISNNTVENNLYGIWLVYQYNNRIYHNNFLNNATQAYDSGVNYWDNGYPSGGNYWNDYTGADENRGENQDIPGSDGIGDTPYYIPGDNNRDRYPLRSPWAPVIPVTIDIHPETLNLKSRGKWITCFIELPEGYDVADIDIGSIRLNGVVPAEPKPTGIGGRKLMVKFSRSAVQAIVSIGEVELTVTGSVNGIPFTGRDTIRAIDLSIDTLYNARLSVDLNLDNGVGLSLRFYTYWGAFQAETVLRNGAAPAHVVFIENVPHPESRPIQNATLVLTDGDNAIPMASIVVERSDLMGRLVDIYAEWSFVSYEEMNVSISEIVGIYLQWPFAPT